jgi:hypothetical protein
MRALASRLAEECGDGCGLTNLKMIRKFYLTYGQLVDLPIGHSPRDLYSNARYKLHLPSEAELRAEMRREVKALAAPKKHGDAQ